MLLIARYNDAHAPVAVISVSEAPHGNCLFACFSACVVHSLVVVAGRKLTENAEHAGAPTRRNTERATGLLGVSANGLLSAVQSEPQGYWV